VPNSRLLQHASWNTRPARTVVWCGLQSPGCYVNTGRLRRLTVTTTPTIRRSLTAASNWPITSAAIQTRLESPAPGVTRWTLTWSGTTATCHPRTSLTSRNVRSVYYGKFQYHVRDFTGRICQRMTLTFKSHLFSVRDQSRNHGCLKDGMRG